MKMKIRTMLSGLTGRPAAMPASTTGDGAESGQYSTIEDKRPARSRTDDTLGNGATVAAGDAVSDEPVRQLRRPRIKHIRIDGELGEGGMGVVYLGYDPNLKRRVAVKAAIRTGDLDEDKSRGLRERLRREAQALAMLNHDNIVKVYESVEDDHGEVYVVMEYVDGCTLRDWLRHKRTVREIVEVFLAAARGLMAAHEAGLVHRDFKPTNVLIDVKGNVRVVDFGLARQGEEVKLEAQAGLDELTRPGAISGTPAYMAAEQWRGERGDARSDQFAFCVALFEALYGQRPFPGYSEPEVQRHVLRGELVFPARPAARRRVSRRLKRLLERGLALQPDHRFPSMADLYKELEETIKSTWRWEATAAITLSSVALVGTIAGKYIHAERVRVYQETCLQPARIAYWRGDLRNAREILENQICIDIAPRSSSVQASARALEAMEHVLYGAEGELPLSTVTPRRRTADAFVAEAYETISRLYSAHPHASRTELLALLDDQRADILALFDEAKRQSHETSVALHGQLVVEALLGDDSNADLQGRLDAAIRHIESMTTEVPFLLHYAYLSLERDHGRAATELRELIARTESNGGVTELLRAELAFRTSLMVLATPDDAGLRREAKELLARAPMPGNLLLRAHLDLAHVALELPADGHSSHLDAARDAAPRLWWDTQLWDALEQVEARLAEQAIRTQFAADVQQLVSEAQAPSPNPGEIRAKLDELHARNVEISSEQRAWLKWAELVGMLHAALERRDPNELDEILGTVEASDLNELPSIYVERVWRLAADVERTLRDLDSVGSSGIPRPPRPKQTFAETSKYKPRYAKVTFYAGAFDGSDFEVAGRAEQIVVSTPVGLDLPIGKLRVRCGAHGGNMGTDQTFELGVEGLAIECHKDGPRAR